MDTQSIRKEVLLNSDIDTVWNAITIPEQFGSWFMANLSGEFVVGEVSTGNITYPGYEHFMMELHIESIVPKSLFAYRWHPYAVDLEVDYSNEPMTLVEFRLAEGPEGVHLTISESGFENIPEHRRAEAFRMNDGGWAEQTKNIAAYVSR